MDDRALFELLRSENPARFQELRAEIDSRFNALKDVMTATARKRAPDLDPDEIVQEVVTKATETLFAQFVQEDVGFRFDPALAPFGAWIFGMMGGAKTRGVIDSMRAALRRQTMRTQNASDEVLDRAIQYHRSGARWQHGGGAASTLQTGSDDIDSDFDPQDLLATLSPRENLILRCEVGLDQLDGMKAHELRQVIKDCGFTADEEDDLMRRALTEGVLQLGRGQTQLAKLLDLSVRSIGKLKVNALVKLKQRFFDGDWPGRDRNAG